MSRYKDWINAQNWAVWIRCSLQFFHDLGRRIRLLHRFLLFDCIYGASSAMELWIGLACLDVYALRIKRDLHSPVLVSLFVVGEWVTTTLSLAVACSSAAIVFLYSYNLSLCKSEHLPCFKYQLAVTFAFVTWFLIAMSSYLMLWILASV